MFLAQFTLKPIWIWLWLLFGVLSSIPSCLAGRWSDLPSLLLLGLLGSGLSCLELRRSLFQKLLLVFLGLTVLLGGIVQLLAPRVWLNSDRSSLFSFLSSLKEDLVTATSSRSWRIPEGVNQTELKFEAKLESGEVGWQWFLVSGGFRLEPLAEEGVRFTRISTPKSSDPYLMQTFTLAKSVAGQTFRVELEMRSSTPIPAEGCRGVWLQVWYEGGEASCLPVALTPAWQTFSHTWTAPEGTTSKVIRIVLNDFDGLTYDITQPKLYQRINGTWQELKPLLPTVPALTTSWEAAESESGRGLELSKQWQTFHVDVTRKTPAQTLTATLVVPSGVTVATRKVTLNVSAKPVAENIRQSYLFGHPNLAGHTVAVCTLIILALSSGIRVQLFASALGFAACSFTGSRTAWFVLLAGVAVLLWLKQPKRRKWLVALYCVAGLVLAVSWRYLGRFQISGVDNPSSRQDIWLTSFDIARDHFWLGIGAAHQTFSDLWFHYNSKATELVTHAHNVVLEWLVNFGVLGGLAIVWLLVGLLRLAWLRQKWVGVTIGVAIFALNMADVSLFYIWVLTPLMLYLNTRE